MDPHRTGRREPVIDVDRRDDAPAGDDLLTLGRHIRHIRTERGLTLHRLAAAAGTTASHLSLVENGHREPRLSLLTAVATALGVELRDLLSSEPPSRRAALEIALAQAQRGGLYAELNLPTVRPGKSLPTDVLEALVGLHTELTRRADAAIATPEEARRANTALRRWMRERNNYLPEIEEAAEESLRTGGYTSGALTHRSVTRMAEHLGFTLIHVDDLPHSTRTVTDLANGTIYLPPASIPGGHGLRSLALQAIAHRVLGHERPRDYADFLRQRIEINYFAAACLLPRRATVAFLGEAKRARDLAVEDLRDAFGVTHETAAQRMTNLLTSELDIRLHFLRVGDDGAIYKGYENDGIPLPTDGTGAIEGQLVCRQWPARRAFTRRDRTTEYHQYTDTPAGTYWAATQTGAGSSGAFSISVGVPFASAKWFRGRETSTRTRSTCPDARCCKQPRPALAERWAAHAWPSAAVHAQILAPLPSGTFPGVDESEVFRFLEQHARPSAGAVQDAREVETTPGD
jgi:transcriptional regulator with XRE-family HTH domain